MSASLLRKAATSRLYGRASRRQARGRGPPPLPCTGSAPTSSRDLGAGHGNSSTAEAALLHLVWRLIAFSEINGHVPAPTVPFALERYIANGSPPQDMLVRIRHADGAVTVAVHAATGAPVLLMDGLIAREPADMAEIDLQDEMPREMRL